MSISPSKAGAGGGGGGGGVGRPLFPNLRASPSGASLHAGGGAAPVQHSYTEIAAAKAAAAAAAADSHHHNGNSGGGSGLTPPMGGARHLSSSASTPSIGGPKPASTPTSSSTAASHTAASPASSAAAGVVETDAWGRKIGTLARARSPVLNEQQKFQFATKQQLNAAASKGSGGGGGTRLLTLTPVGGGAASPGGGGCASGGGASSLQTPKRDKPRSKSYGSALGTELPDSPQHTPHAVNSGGGGGGGLAPVMHYRSPPTQQTRAPLPHSQSDGAPLQSLSPQHVPRHTPASTASGGSGAALRPAGHHSSISSPLPESGLPATAAVIGPAEGLEPSASHLQHLLESSPLGVGASVRPHPLTVSTDSTASITSTHAGGSGTDSGHAPFSISGHVPIGSASSPQAYMAVRDISVPRTLLWNHFRSPNFVLRRSGIDLPPRVLRVIASYAHTPLIGVLSYGSDGPAFTMFDFSAAAAAATSTSPAQSGGSNGVVVRQLLAADEFGLDAHGTDFMIAAPSTAAATAVSRTKSPPAASASSDDGTDGGGSDQLYCFDRSAPAHVQLFPPPAAAAGATASTARGYAWQTMNAMRTPRIHAPVCYAPHCHAFLVFGGALDLDDSTVLATVEAYHPATRQWSLYAGGALPEPLQMASATYVPADNAIVLIGGTGSSTSANAAAIPRRELLILSLQSGAWAVAASKLTTGRVGHSTLYYVDRTSHTPYVLVTGGRDASGAVLASCERFEWKAGAGTAAAAAVTNGWKSFPPFRVSRYRHALIEVDHRLFAVGGIGPEDNSFPEIEFFDETRHAWAPLHPSTAAVAGAGIGEAVAVVL